MHRCLHASAGCVSKSLSSLLLVAVTLVVCVAAVVVVVQDQPEELRSQLEALLQQQDIPYSYSKTSKFANFVNKTLL